MSDGRVECARAADLFGKLHAQVINRELGSLSLHVRIRLTSGRGETNDLQVRPVELDVLRLQLQRDFQRPEHHTATLVGDLQDQVVVPRGRDDHRFQCEATGCVDDHEQILTVLVQPNVLTAGERGVVTRPAVDIFVVGDVHVVRVDPLKTGEAIGHGLLRTTSAMNVIEGDESRAFCHEDTMRTRSNRERVLLAAGVVVVVVGATVVVTVVVTVLVVGGSVVAGVSTRAQIQL